MPSAAAQAAIVAVTVPCCVLAARARSTVVTAKGITIRVLRGRFIPWDQVDAISVGDLAGERAIDLRLADGSRRRLPAPVERHRRSRDVAFDDKYAAIMQAWLRSSGPGDETSDPGRKPAADRPVSRRRPGSPIR
ncbi:hypothetical protein ACFQ9X_14560 [Catenulispora yoronensis]